MKRYFMLIIILSLAVFISSYCLAASPMESDTHKSHQEENKEQGLELSGKLEDGLRVIEIKASRYKFDPDPIVVQLGEKVRLVVTSTDVVHGIAISEFKVSLPVPAGKTESVEFVADKKGTFPAYCSVYCGSGHGKMRANFIVK